MRNRWFPIVAVSVLAVAAPAPARAALQDEDITILRQLIGDIESQRQIILAPLGAGNTMVGLVVVDRDRAGEIAGWLVTSGQLNPDSVAAWTREQLNISRGALRVMKRQLSELEAQRGGTAPPPPTAAAAPTGGSGAAPGGTGLKNGRGHGSWGVDCTWAQTPDPAAFRDGGDFNFSVDAEGATRAEFHTTGKVYGFDYGAIARMGDNGEILRGGGGGGGWTLRWDGAMGLNETNIFGGGAVVITFTDRWGGGSCSGRWRVP